MPATKILWIDGVGSFALCDSQEITIGQAFPGNSVDLAIRGDISRNAAGNMVLSKAIENASTEIQAGERLAKQLEKSGHFPPTVVEMIAVAEESNTLDTVLVTISDNLERTTFRRLETVIRLVEPMMLLILAGLVMFVVLALMLPVLNSANTL